MPSAAPALTTLRAAVVAPIPVDAPPTVACNSNAGTAC